MTTEDFQLHLNEAIKDLRTNRPQYTGEMAQRVGRGILSRAVIKEGASPEMPDKALEELATSLVVGGNRYSPETIRLQTIHNQLRAILRRSCSYRSKEIVVPSSVRRHLIVPTHDSILQYTRAAAVLEQSLLHFHPPPSQDRASQEIHYACCFVASAAIFSLVLMPDYHRFLLGLTSDQVFFRPTYLVMRVENSDALQRYWMAYPSSVYLKRLIIHQLDCGTLKSDPGALPDPVSLFRFDAFDLRSFRPVFRKWTTGMLADSGVEYLNGISLKELRLAAITLASCRQRHPGSATGPYPPFLTTILSRKIKSYSFANSSLGELIPGYVPTRKDHGERKYKTAFMEFQDLELHATWKEMAEVRNGLLNVKATAALRTSAADEVSSILSRRKELLTANDAWNVEAFGRYLTTLILSPGKMSTMNVKTGPLWSLLSDASNLRKRIIDLNEDDFTVVLRRQAAGQSSGNALSSTTSFLEFLHIDSEGAFEVPDLRASARKLGIKIGKIPTLKPFLTLGMIDQILATLSGTEDPDGFFRTPSDPEDPDQHLRYTRAHIARFASGTGLRIKELVNARLNDILPDRDMTLIVRKSKTSSGERNIPLGLLLPDSYLSEFRRYIEYRRSLAANCDLLFVNSVGRQFDKSGLSSLISGLYRDAGATDAEFHTSRHTFGNVFLLVWIVAFHGDLVPLDTPFLRNKIFSEGHLRKFKRLFLGFGEPKKGQDAFSHVLQTLARLIGHSGPVIAMQDYLHVLDWIFYFFSRHYEPREIEISSKTCADLLQVSFPTLPERFRGRGFKTVAVQELLDEQILRLEKLAPRLMKNQSALRRVQCANGD